MGSCASSQSRRKKVNQIGIEQPQQEDADEVDQTPRSDKVVKPLIEALDHAELENLREIVREKYKDLPYDEVDRLIEKYLQDAQMEKGSDSTAERTADYSPESRIRLVGEHNLSFESFHHEDSELKAVTPQRAYSRNDLGVDSEASRSNLRHGGESSDMINGKRRKQPPLMYNPHQKARDINTLKLLEIFPSLSYYTIIDAFHRYDWDVDLTADFLQKVDQAHESGREHPFSDDDGTYRSGREGSTLNVPGTGEDGDGRTSRKQSTTHSDFMPSDSDLLEAICKLKYIDDDEVHVQALRTLCDLSLNEELQKKISDFGGLPPISTILERKLQYFTEKSSEIVHLATSCLANLALLEDHTDYFTCRRLCDVAIEGLQMKDTLTLTNCSRILANLAFNNSENEALIAESDGIEALIQLLERCEEAHVAMEALAALANLARNKKYQLTISRGEGLTILNKFAKSEVPDVQQQALRMAGNLCMNKKVRKTFATQGGIEILEAIVRENEDPYTIKLCMLTVANISMDFTLQPEMVKAGLFESVVKNLENEKMNNYEIYIHIIRFLGSLSENVKVRDIFTKRRDVIDFILKFREEADAEIQTIIEHFLTNIDYDSDQLLRLVHPSLAHHG